MTHPFGINARPDFASRGSNQTGMRAYNERLVLSLVRRAGMIAKADIARKTGLSAQTVSVIMRSLEQDGLIERGKPLRGRIGQPAVPIALAKDGAFFLGLNVGRRSLDLVLIDFIGTVRHRIRLRHAYPTPDGTVAFAADAIAQAIHRLPPEHRDRIAGIGIALPFQLWAWSDALGIDATEMEAWRTRDVAAEISAFCDFPVFMCNDASAACGAELVFGDPTPPRDFLYFFVGFFIGGGLALDGSLYTGASGNAAALGSMTVTTSEGRLCQLVDVASLATLEKEVTAKGRAGSMVWDTPADWTIPQDAVELWLSGAARGIGQAILSSVCLIDVSLAIIDGWMPEQLRADLVQRVRNYIAEHAVPGIGTPLVQEGSVGFDARALGAASLPLSKRFLVERTAFLKGTPT